MRVCSRHNLVQWVIDNAPSRISRHVDESGLLSFGVFDKISPDVGGGWLVRMISPRTGGIYYCAVIPVKPEKYELKIISPESVCWENWGGGGVKCNLENGDIPQLMCQVKRMSKR